MARLTSPRIQSAASTNLTNVKAAPGLYYGATVFNAGASIAYLKLYDKASAPVLGTDVPFATFPLAANAQCGLDSVIIVGKTLVNGLSYAITAGGADTDSTAVALNQVCGILHYE